MGKNQTASGYWRTPDRLEQRRNWYHANRDAVALRRRAKLYKTSVQQLEQLKYSQDNRCAICRCVLDKKFHVDHIHNTEKIRGLLCRLCNVGLGHFGDSVELLQKAREYLSAHQ